MIYELTEIDDSEVTEPVSLAEVKAYMNVDQDYNSMDDDLNIILTTARIRLEQYLNVGLAKRDVKLQWYGGGIELPLSPINDIVSVSDKDGVMSPDRYSISGLGNRVLSISGTGSDCNYFYSRISFDVEVSCFNTNHSAEVYTSIYNCGYEKVPSLLKQAVMAECDHLYKLKGMPVTDVISPNASRLASGYSKNLVL